MRKILLLVFMSFAIILSLNLALGEIMLNQPQAIYNLGDTLQLKATIKPSQDGSGFFELNLACENASKNFHRENLNLKRGEEKKIETSLLLVNRFLEAMKGDCNVKAKFLNTLETSQSFKISNKIDVVLSAEEMSVEAGEEIKIRGTALKENGKQVEGFIEISVENINLKTKSKVTKGSFEVDFAFSGNAKSGNYVLKARVYEEYLGEETNEGEAKIVLNIKSVPAKIEIAILKQNVDPGQNFSFKPIIYDQSNSETQGEVSVKVYDSYENVLFQGILKSGIEKEIFLKSNENPGYWKIEANALNLKTERLFYVNELEKASFEIINDTLIITNIGNVVYRKPVQIVIGNVVKVENLDLDVGKSKKFKLLAPDGEYDVRVSDGDEEVRLSDIALTGKVVDVKGAGGKFAFGSYPMVWLFLIIVFGLFILLLIQRVVKKKSYSYPVSGVLRKAEKKELRRGVEKPTEEETKGEKVELIAPVSYQVERAEHSLVLHGRKEDAGIIAVRIKDLHNVKKFSAETVNNIINRIVENKGTMYETGDFIIGIFSSLTTKTFANQMIAVKISKQINEMIKQYNEKAEKKINYGIALNSGNLILKKEKDRLKFTTIGNTINLAKRIAEFSDKEVLLSEDMQKKVLSQIRAEKETKQGVNVYHIKSIIDRDRNKEFIRDFLTRLAK